MKCICITPCQVRLSNGSIKTFRDGEVYDFDDATEVPRHFETLEVHVLDFATATEDELKAMKWSFKQLNDFTLATYNFAMPKGSKMEMIKRLVDLRFRHLEVK